jgi:hypothetical protein
MVASPVMEIAVTPDGWKCGDECMSVDVRCVQGQGERASEEGSSEDEEEYH